MRLVQHLLVDLARGLGVAEGHRGHVLQDGHLNAAVAAVEQGDERARRPRRRCAWQRGGGSHGATLLAIVGARRIGGGVVAGLLGRGRRVGRAVGGCGRRGVAVDRVCLLRLCLEELLLGLRFCLEDALAVHVRRVSISLGLASLLGLVSYCLFVYLVSRLF